MRIVFFVSSFIRRPPVGRTVQFGSQPAKERSKRTCGTRAAGLRRREAAARCALRAQIHNSKFRIMKSGCSLRSACLQRERAAGLRRPSLRPARPLQGRFLPEASPQPSGRACDVEEQPSARGRLRAAGPAGPVCWQAFSPQPAAAGRAAADFAGLCLHSGGSLRSACTSGREERAFAGRSCGPLRLLRIRKFSIQNSEL